MLFDVIFGNLKEQQRKNTTQNQETHLFTQFIHHKDVTQNLF